MTAVPDLRVRRVNDAELRLGGDYVLYWMIASRRAASNFALDRAIELAHEHHAPLLVLEPLRCGYDWASDRLHRFVIDGMADNAAAFGEHGVAYFPYLEPEARAGKGLIERLAERAIAVVTDDYPAFFLPRMVAAAGSRLDVRLEAVDSNGLLPMRAADQVFSTAYALRRFLQSNLEPHLSEGPRPDPLAVAGGARTDGDGLRERLENLDLAPVLERWAPAFEEPPAADDVDLSAFPIDHDVAPVPHRGGTRAALERLGEFIADDLADYGERRSDLRRNCASRLSDYLHFGHLSTHQVLAAIAEHEDWSPDDVTDLTSGKRSGWWGMSASAESFLDELVTWRELGFNMCWQRDDYTEYESLPDWAQQTLAEHAGDERPYVYSLEQFEAAATHDELWNAAQRQLLAEGRIHNYLRMLWGKKILHWSESPLAALEVMIELNNKYATDGRDPNSYSGIFWCLGRYDRAWGPEREVFGKIRYMTSKSTRSKFSVDGYIERYGEGSADRLF
jgi:deoxyribodipyrimidine photo-lyase